jgi:hypothetical protein
MMVRLIEQTRMWWVKEEGRAKVGTKTSAGMYQSISATSIRFPGKRQNRRSEAISKRLLPEAWFRESTEKRTYWNSVP